MFSSLMVNAWIAAGCIAVASGVVGFFVVARGMSFAAHALPMAAFPGAAAAALVGVDPLLGIVVFAGLGAVGIARLEGRHERHEVATALCLVMLLGVGALLLSMTRQYSQSVFALLFGAVLGVSRGELAPIAALCAATVAAMALLFRPLLLDSISPELAKAAGVSTRAVGPAFLCVLALAAAMALPVAGSLLAFSLMVGPAATARLLTARPLRALLISAGLSLCIVWAALALSYLSDWPVGFFVGGLGALCYGACRAWAAVRGRRGRAAAHVPS